MYSLKQYGQMVTDEVRFNSYYEALKRAIRPGDIVIDLGAGTGIFSLIACQLGAKRVYAIEPNDWVGLVKPMAEANGFADRIIPIKDYINRVELPEQADVVFGDLRASTPLTPVNINAMQDLLRFLKPGGILIPQHDRIFVSFVSAANFYENNLLMPWQKNVFNADLSDALHFLRNNIIDLAQYKLDSPLFRGQLWVDIDYATGELPNATTSLDWIVDKAGSAHFILIWFETQLIDEIGFTTAPSAPRHATVYGYWMLPLQAPLDFAPGDKITLDLRADLVQGNYIYGWNTALRADEGRGALKATFRQSTFFGSQLTDKRQELHRPASKLNNDGQITRVILSGFDEGAAHEKIARTICQHFPDQYTNPEAVLPYITELSAKYGK